LERKGFIELNSISSPEQRLEKYMDESKEKLLKEIEALAILYDMEYKG